MIELLHGEELAAFRKSVDFRKSIEPVHDSEWAASLLRLPFSVKVSKSITRIWEWIVYHEGKVYVSFSGGKDSTVLLHLCRRIYPQIEAVFVNTGLEYPELVDFALSFENVTEIKPGMSYKKVIENYGYPAPTKEIARCVRQARMGQAHALNKLYGRKVDKDGKKSGYCCEKWQFLLDAPFKVSEQCCDVMKKRPAEKFEKKTGKVPIIATMSAESMNRNSEWLKTGCNAFNNNRPKSTPLSFWSEQDILRYIVELGLKIPSVYGEIVPLGLEYLNDGTQRQLYGLTGVTRTGCMGCMFGVHLEPSPNRFQRMAVTHPKHYDAYINKLGQGAVMDYIGVDYRPDGQMSLFDNGGMLGG